MVQVIDEAPINDIDHAINPELITQNPDKIAVWGYPMTQYNLKDGLRKFDKRADKAAVKELTTLHVMNTWKANHMHKLPKEKRASTLSSRVFIKEKWDGTVKGCMCIDGSPQRKTIPKKSAASPTLTTESVFMTCLILAHKRRHN